MKNVTPKELAEKFIKTSGDIKNIEDWFQKAFDAGWNAGRSVANENNAKHLFYRSHGHSQY